MTTEKSVKQETMALNGDEAVAFAVKQCDVDVVAAYPITPQTIIVEKFSEYVANGEVQTEFVCTESEHSAMTASLSASATGARTFTASASAGLALMHEMLFVTAGSRAPVVMAVANRALSSPLTFMVIIQTVWLNVTVVGFTFTLKTLRKLTIQSFKPSKSLRTQVFLCRLLLA